MMDLGV
jgi:hypothetical protein